MNPKTTNQPKFKPGKRATFLNFILATLTFTILFAGCRNKNKIEPELARLVQELEYLANENPEDFEEFCDIWTLNEKMTGCLSDTLSYDCNNDYLGTDVDKWLKKHGLKQPIRINIINVDALDEYSIGCIQFEAIKNHLRDQIGRTQEIMEQERFQQMYDKITKIQIISRDQGTLYISWGYEK